MRKPTICAAIIARNEERDLPRCVRSLKGIADFAVLVDTGSTDLTLGVFQHECLELGLSYRMDVYREASEPDPERPGEWRIVNFGKARNRALELARESGCSHIFWIDADDIVETPLAVRRAAYMPRAVYGMWIELDRTGQRQVHYRLFPADA